MSHLRIECFTEMLNFQNCTIGLDFLGLGDRQVEGFLTEVERYFLDTDFPPVDASLGFSQEETFSK